MWCGRRAKDLAFVSVTAVLGSRRTIVGMERGAVQYPAATWEQCDECGRMGRVGMGAPGGGGATCGLRLAGAEGSGRKREGEHRLLF